ncbi:phosphoribosyl transferase domain protein [Lentithecium fluviatile CBS 122367]|uniref:Phosphoribosyl transferase domain protein n=1 Tax=Lentithecium fluviatile CBS 122367 TaxID=1168545 RepID=A0A6G1JDH7_9PLEO|nr:phosphoribosyl transferase domain protein [Lentithecium fluviatile CBS 122367]
MATLTSLKAALRQKATEKAPSSPQVRLSPLQYSAGFDILSRGGNTTYASFILPQLSSLLIPFFASRDSISVLEIGPGPVSILGYLPGFLRRKIRRYAAFEPKELFAVSLEHSLSEDQKMKEGSLPWLERPPDIRTMPFDLEANGGSGIGADGDKYEIILFCHSMYGMRPKHAFIEKALKMLVEEPQGGMVIVFHRDEVLDLNGLVCHRTASFPTGVIRVANNDEALDCFARFIEGFVMQYEEVDEALRIECRKVCRALGRYEEAYPDHLLFSAPEVMLVFTPHSTALPELTAHVPLVKGEMTVKNREAQLHRPAAIVRPTEIRHVQECVRWALKHRVGLAVVGGSHSGHCLWPHVVSIDMGAFNQIHICKASGGGEKSGSGTSSLVIAEAGCKTGDIIRETMSSGLTVPLGARPSVGAGLWLQGGIGHLARLHGLACDAIIGAIVVSVNSGQVYYIGCVPPKHRPADAVRPENDADLLWAIRGAGTNFGIVVSVTFKPYPAPTYLIRNWVDPLSDSYRARLELSDFDSLVATNLPKDSSADAYLYWDAGQLHLGVALIKASTTESDLATRTPTPTNAVLELEDGFKAVDGVGLFETEMYISGMHGGHGGGKTSSFKRCLFLKGIGKADVADRLVAAIETRPSPLCYLHLLQGGGAVGDVEAEGTAFGCREWDFACVITGVWPRDQDGTEMAQAAVRWVYNIATDLLPLSSGTYGADLGPDPRDTVLATKAFGPNRTRLARLKYSLDPHNVLAYACPLPKPQIKPKLIILVTGESGAGKDYCADVWVSVFNGYAHKRLTARTASISDATKREYAAVTGADLNRLLRDRAYKEKHRPALTTFYKEQVRGQHQLPEKHFLDLVYDTVNLDVLLITGMREEAPVAVFSHLVPESRLVEVHVRAGERTLQIRRGCHSGNNEKKSNSGMSKLTALGHRPSLVFDNDETGEEIVKRFAEHRLLPFFHDDLQRLADMVQAIPDFPRPGIEFRHVLAICQQRGGLALCTSLLQNHYGGDWAKIDAVACCEAGGYTFASALALRVGIPMVLIRKAGKLPPPSVSVTKPTSHISSLSSGMSTEDRFEMERDVLPKDASVVVVDDVLATGKTLCAVLQLLGEAGIAAERISVMVLAELPVHRGRELLRQHGFGRVIVQSLLVFDSA